MRDRSLRSDLGTNDGERATDTRQRLRDDKTSRVVDARLVDKETVRDDLERDTADLEPLVATGVALDEAGNDTAEAETDGEGVSPVVPLARVPIGDDVGVAVRVKAWEDWEG